MFSDTNIFVAMSILTANNNMYLRVCLYMYGRRGVRLGREREFLQRQIFPSAKCFTYFPIKFMSGGQAKSWTFSGVS